MAHPQVDTVETATSRRPLVAARGAALTLVGLAVVCFAVLAVWVHGTQQPKPVDNAVYDWLMQHTGTLVQRSTLAVTDPVLTVGICAVVTVLALVIRRWDVAVLAGVGPAVGLLLESAVLKPAIDRRFGLVETLSHGAVKAAYAFPSGHETGVASVAVLLALLVLRSAWSRLVRSVVLTVLAVWTVVAALALVRSRYHYVTDTVGGVLLAVTVMLVTAMLIDVVSSPAGRGRPRTARAA